MNTAEFVTPRHPDKMCDRISDSILDLCLEHDPNSRVAIETMGGHGLVTLTGELTSTHHVTINEAEEIVRRIAGDGLKVNINIVQQSPEIANGVDTGGAGDQGIMRGYATRGTETYMPLEYELARDLCKYLYEKYPVDGKTQITLDNYGAIKVIVASFQNTTHEELLEAIGHWIMQKKPAIHEDVKIHANPAGDWKQGGFEADTGLTGRKLAVDNYGPALPLGGGAFSGKDATKVDRSAAYMARLIAVDMLRSRPELKQVDVELAYAIGVAQPVSAVAILHYVSGEPAKVQVEGYDLTPAGIINQLDLRRPQFAKLAEWGHFGNGNLWDE